jgi:hypothetical protein
LLDLFMDVLHVVRRIQPSFTWSKGLRERIEVEGSVGLKPIDHFKRCAPYGPVNGIVEGKFRLWKSEVPAGDMICNEAT